MIEMEIVLSFIAGFVLAAAIAFFVARAVVRTRSSQAALSATAQAEARYKVEIARLESDLNHETARNEELKKRNEEDIAAREKIHKEAMDDLKTRFDDVVARVSAQMKDETGEMLKTRQKEFSETSSASLGQIVNPLKEKIEELKKAMDDGSK